MGKNYAQSDHSGFDELPFLSDRFFGIGENF